MIYCDAFDAFYIILCHSIDGCIGRCADFEDAECTKHGTRRVTQSCRWNCTVQSLWAERLPISDIRISDLAMLAVASAHVLAMARCANVISL